MENKIGFLTYRKSACKIFQTFDNNFWKNEDVFICFVSLESANFTTSFPTFYEENSRFTIHHFVGFLFKFFLLFNIPSKSTSSALLQGQSSNVFNFLPFLISLSHQNKRFINWYSIIRTFEIEKKNDNFSVDEYA